MYIRSVLMTQSKSATKLNKKMIFRITINILYLIINQLKVF